ncbi:Large-conductance mechanosensitive channel [Botrimarina colliarenosi]|uniref:Large-conductance mechanosensitive channel n=1 Tax=Botrimarina colliarenosi TaxID=2528001 RepID=A0A5C6A9R1_9BACT|nr:large-conductance mechanosensitive channel protein MscL [Botrimarina colliarenosi]TWT95935.1 Large-conductance mechanosensitive channel [Botrimarina colliarenosi]
MGMLKEFKEFAMRGSVVDLAVGVVIGAAFGKITTTFVSAIITPIVGYLTGGVDVKDWAYTLPVPELAEGMKAPTLAYGELLQVLIDFIIIAFAIFMAIKAMNSLTKTTNEAEESPAEPPEDILLLREIRDSLKKS